MSMWWKRSLSLFVAASMTFGLLPAQALAEAIEDAGIGEEVIAEGDEAQEDSSIDEIVQTEESTRIEVLAPTEEEIPAAEEPSVDEDANGIEEEAPSPDVEVIGEEQIDEVTAQGTTADYEYVYDKENNATITHYLGDNANLVIPDTIRGHNVAVIGYACFENNANLTSVTLPNSVKKIDDYAFSRCTALQTVTLPSNLEVLGFGAFQDCTALTSVAIPKDVQTREHCGEPDCPGPFEGCTALRTVSFAEGMTKIPNGLFLNCGLEAVTIPDTVTTIGSYAFEGCTSLATLVFPDSVRELGCGAFGGCTSLAKVRLPKDVQTDEHCGDSDYPGPFDGCTALKEVELASGFTKFADGLFRNTNLKSMTLPKTLIEIGKLTFADCAQLSTVVWNQNLAKIGSRAFAGCVALGDANLPDSMTLLGCQAFFGCVGLKEIYIPKNLNTHPVCGYADNRGPFDGCVGDTKVTIADGITAIPNGLFWGFTSLSEVQIPGTVTSIGLRSFQETENLRTIVIPESVTSISSSAFAFSGLTEIDVPASVTNIGSYTFDSCENLTRATLPATLDYLLDGLFRRCALKEFTIPDSVRGLGNEVFCDCASLKKVNWGKKLQVMNSDVFKNCSSLTEVMLPDTVWGLGEGAFENCDALTKVSFDSRYDAMEMMPRVFADCDALTEVSLGLNLKKIPSEVFYHCDALESISIPGRVTGIGENAFAECVKLSKVTIPESVTSIGDTVFSYPARMTVYGVVGTAAENWAKKNGATFVASISGATISAITNRTYTGAAIKPAVTVKLAGTTLRSGTDYTVSYSNNVNVGTATVTVTGKGDYTGSIKTTFGIVKAASKISLAAQIKTYTGKALAYSGRVTKSGSTGKVTYRYYSDSACTKAVAAANVKGAGTYYVKAILAADASYKAATSAAAKFVIAKAASRISLAAQTKTYTGKALAYSGRVTKSGSAGKVTYRYYSDSACTKAVAAANVKGARTYYVKAILAADANHKAATSAAAKFVIAKRANPITVKAVLRTASFTTLKSKSVIVAAPLSVSKAQGKVTYAKVTSGSSSALTVNKTTGKVTVKKGTKKGTYTIKIKVAAAGNANYKSGSKTIACKVTVK